MYEMDMPQTIAERCEPRGMITLRGELGALSDTLARVLGAVPGQRQVVSGTHGAVAWMSPDELLVTCAHDRADGLVESLQDALKGQHHLAVNVSDARAVFAVTGPRWRDVLGKGMPVDFRPAAFGEGQIRRSRLGQVAAAIWMTAPNRVELVCFRSVADFVEDWLVTAAQGGSFPEHY